jgi:hypothetical protein
VATILIPTIQDDIHAAAVALVLERNGHRPIRWFCGDVPTAAQASFAIGSETPQSAALHAPACECDFDAVDVFWNRRVHDPIIQDELDGGDREFALRESKRFVRGLLMTLPDDVFAVNDYQRASAAENKLLQLRTARAVGMAVPETLVSNDPRRIRAFLAQHAAAGTICKSFRPVTWEGENQVAILYTSKVTVDDLPSDAMLRLAPAIFQRYVPKAYEVRVTAMGQEMFAARLDSQRSERYAVDWRLGDDGSLAIEPMALPEAVAHQCRALLARLGLVFGCFDFVVTPAGEYVFLEINQMGQFLWKEEQCAEMPLLQAFCDFLVSRNPGFRYEARAASVRFRDVFDEACVLIERDRRVHVQPRTFRHIVRDVA